MRCRRAKTLKGFHREQFEDAWARYLHPEPREGENPLPERDCGGSENARAHPLAARNRPQRPAPQAGSRGLAAETAEPGLVEGTAATEGLVEGASAATDADEAEVERVRAKFGADEDGLATRGQTSHTEGSSRSRGASNERRDLDRRATRREVEGDAGWVYAKTRAGDIPRVPLPGRYYRYRLDVIERFEAGELETTERRA